MTENFELQLSLYTGQHANTSQYCNFFLEYKDCTTGLVSSLVMNYRSFIQTRNSNITRSSYGPNCHNKDFGSILFGYELNANGALYSYMNIIP